MELTPLGADRKPADSARRAFLLLLPRAATCGDCFSNRCSWYAADAASGKNLAAHRRSNLLSRSIGILLITKAPGFGCPGLKHLNARGPIKVHPTSSALAVLDSRPIPPAPAAFLESCRSYPDHIGLRSTEAFSITLPLMISSFALVRAPRIRCRTRL